MKRPRFYQPGLPPIVDHMRRRREERLRTASVPRPAANETPDADASTADSSGGREGWAPEGSSGAALGCGVIAPANAHQLSAHPEPVAGLTDDDELGAELLLDDEPEPEDAPPAPGRIDWAHVAALREAAFREARESGERRTLARTLSGGTMAGAKLAPRRTAASRDPCARCEVPGWLGCEHQAPYEPPAVEPVRGGKHH